MHNNIMASGLRDRPSMLATRRYPQWRSRFLQYIDTRPNGDALRKCILSGPYKPTTVLVQAVAATDDSSAIPEHTTLRKCGKLSKGYNKKNLALIAKYFKKIYKPTNNNLRTSSNSRNKNVDTTQWYKNDNQSEQLGIKGRKPKRVKDFAYHKEKMLMCKQVEQGVPLQAEQYDWLADTDEEIDEQEMQAHYSYMTKIQEQSESVSNTCLVETDDSNVIPDSPEMCDDVIQNDQNDVESDDECVALANLIANFKLDVDENK
uniref:Uncharacterized protein n=1 Tax=Tanacetum cinerariifolium TaxID=118510 RepID=A0A699IAF2_TANCI|nr:hypothetical protein [Tanacetum cinerariifolium]GEZ39944.1 hypothetical protein [Tanacetum cinerariifolium]